ncbi:TPA: aldehyde dehydrogenase family protein [Stenotrophomonas maltophilia]|nr:aldehyde dehydrogenase family protein [Stenotrophomonas maltophilia]HEL3778388.1 aldehyde dehydrogenase family protein [Stenotrophomonas maltophilia]HEL5006817.1 aldehyde dehydrogenase family protein [Stenotrophomonas maltophilia]
MTDSRATEAVKNWINGSWNEGGAIRQAVSPSTGQPLGSYLDTGQDEARLAIEAARTAFDTSNWPTERSLRSRALHELADEVAKRAKTMAVRLSQEGGKLLAQTEWELSLASEWLRYGAATALLQTGGRALEAAPGVHFFSDPEPLGVVGVISPWNSPIILSVRAIAPALAAGCTVVLKLPHQTALTNALFAEAVAAVPSLPPGVLNVITETGSIGAAMLVDSPQVDMISYTGSTNVGRTIAANGAKTLKRLNLELGGKAPLVVFDDANLAAVVPQIVMALVAMNGQFCCTGSRVLVQRTVADRLRAALVEAYGNVRLGESEDPQAQLGPLIDKASVARVDAVVAEAASYANVLVRGGPIEEGPLAAGAFYRPSLIEVEDLNAYVVQNEVFGPVQTFEIFEDEADAIARANATEFGLAASVFSEDASRCRRVGKAIRAGHIWMNCWGVMSEQFEQSGFKQSGIGVLCGPRAIEQFQEIKVYATAALSSGS